MEVRMKNINISKEEDTWDNERHSKCRSKKWGVPKKRVKSICKAGLYVKMEITWFEQSQTWDS